MKRGRFSPVTATEERIEDQVRIEGAEHPQIEGEARIEG